MTYFIGTLLKGNRLKQDTGNSGRPGGGSVYDGLVHRREELLRIEWKSANLAIQTYLITREWRQMCLARTVPDRPCKSLTGHQWRCTFHIFSNKGSLVYAYMVGLHGHQFLTPLATCGSTYVAHIPAFIPDGGPQTKTINYHMIRRVRFCCHVINQSS